MCENYFVTICLTCVCLVKCRRIIKRFTNCLLKKISPKIQNLEILNLRHQYLTYLKSPLIIKSGA